MRKVQIMEEGGQLTSAKAKEMLRDGTAHGKKLTSKQKRYFSYIAGGGTPKAENGMTVLDGDTLQFNGPSHADGGIPISYQGNKVEVEGGETAYKADDGSLAVMGNMTNPLSGRKFKQDSKILAKKEQKNNKLMDYSTQLVNITDPLGKWDYLKFNAGKAMMIGTKMKQNSLSESKEHLANIQQAMLDVSGHLGVDPQAFSKGTLQKAKNGMKIIGKAQYQSGGKWDYRNTKTEGVDPVITGFVDLLTQKGYTGFSGPESGVSNRNTKSGHPSRHKTGQALDAFVSQPGAYEAILSDPELSGYLINNGLTAINEYDPKVQSQTGAKEGHLHIGFDRGTPLADQFRNDAAALHKQANPTWAWNKRVAPGQSLMAGPTDKMGDRQWFPWSSEPVGKITPDFASETPSNPRIDAGEYAPVEGLQPITNYNVPSNAKGLAFNQIVPELYAAATNKLEPVFAQKFQPQLFQPYQVSFQDRRNRNQATYRAALQKVSESPEAVGALQAQKFAADNEISADEFRTNQAINNEITNKNISLINDATARNLQLADTQFVRQAQAKSKTKEVNQSVLNSISSKLQQNSLENKTLQVYENLYPHFRYDEQNNYNLQKVGAPGQDYLNTSSFSPSPNGFAGRQVVVRDANGNVKQVRQTTDSQMKQNIDSQTLEDKLQQNIRRRFNTSRVTGFPKTYGYPE